MASGWRCYDRSGHWCRRHMEILAPHLPVLVQIAFSLTFWWTHPLKQRRKHCCIVLSSHGNACRTDCLDWRRYQSIMVAILWVFSRELALSYSTMDLYLAILWRKVLCKKGIRATFPQHSAFLHGPCFQLNNLDQMILLMLQNSSKITLISVLNSIFSSSFLQLLSFYTFIFVIFFVESYRI